MSEKYFTGLNYTLANEDTSLEVDLVKKTRPKNILAIAGSGGRCLPLISAGAEKLLCLDMSKEQLDLVKLRERTIAQLSFEEFLLFWGFAPHAPAEKCRERKALFEKLTLGEDLERFFAPIFESLSWQSLLYEGKWEQTFFTLSKVAKVLLGKACQELFQHKNATDQKEYFQNSFPQARFKLLLFLLGNRKVFDALLYKGSFVKKNIPETYLQFYTKAFQRLFSQGLTRESFFLQLCFLGRIQYAEGNTVEARENIFLEMKENLKKKITQIDYCQKDFLSLVKSAYFHRPQQRFDFVSLSDVPSYFQGDLEKNFMQLLKPCLNPGALVVLRSYLRVPQADLQGYKEVTGEYQKQIMEEKVQMYHIQIFALALQST